MSSPLLSHRATIIALLLLGAFALGAAAAKLPPDYQAAAANDRPSGSNSISAAAAREFIPLTPTPLLGPALLHTILSH